MSAASMCLIPSMPSHTNPAMMTGHHRSSEFIGFGQNTNTNTGGFGQPAQPAQGGGLFGGGTASNTGFGERPVDMAAKKSFADDVFLFLCWSARRRLRDYPTTTAAEQCFWRETDLWINWSDLWSFQQCVVRLVM